MTDYQIFFNWKQYILIYNNMEESATLKCLRIIRERKEKNLPILNGGLGENPFPQAQSIIDALKENAHKKNYSLPEGIPDLNQKLKEHYKTDIYNPDQILVGCGLKELICITLLSFEGTIILINPSWVSYREQVKILKKNLIEISTNKSNEFKLQASELEQAVFKNTDKNKLIIFNNPVNPTGVNYTKQEIESLITILKKYNITIFSDEIYCDLVFKKNFYSISQLLPDQTIIGNSMSKNFACGGYRLGWLIFPESLKELANKCHSNASSIYTCAPIPEQYACLKALTYNSEISNSIEIMRNTFSKLGELCYSKLNQHNIVSSKPEAAWYIFIIFEKYRDKLKKLNIHTSQELSSYLLNTYGIVAVPGSSFGCSEISLRFSFLDINVKKINEKIDIWAANVIKGMDTLITFVNSIK